MAELGGVVWFDYDIDAQGGLSEGQPWAPAWLRETFGDEYFRSPHTINLVRRSPTDEDIALRARCANISGLFLSYNLSITDAALEHLSGLKNLRQLGLDHTSVAGPGLRHIAGLGNLEELWLLDTPLADAGTEHLCELTKLRLLDLRETNVGDATLANLADLVALEELSIGGPGITDGGLVHLQGDCTTNHFPQRTSIR